MLKFFQVCVGKYKSVSETKDDAKKLLKLGCRSDVFSLDGGGYTLKCFYSMSEQAARNVMENLVKHGFDAFIPDIHE